MAIFDQYTLQTVQAIISRRIDEQAAINMDYYNGDHWRNSDGWVGPRPQPTDITYFPTMLAIADGFVSRNVVKELAGRHVAGVVGHEPDWGFTVKRKLGVVPTTDPTTGQERQEDEQPNEAEQALIDEAEDTLTDWWDKRGIIGILRQALAGALLTKRAPVRLYIPPGMRDEYGNLTASDLATALDFIWFQHPGTNEDTLTLQFPSATVYCDKSSRRDVGLFAYRSFGPNDLLTPGQATGPEQAELSYLDDTGNTILRIIQNEGDAEEPLVMPLDSHLTIYEITRDWLVTPQIISQQKTLNMAMSMKQRNVIQAGFLERNFFNVKWPVRTNSDGSTTPLPLATGPGAANSFQGATYEDRDGELHVLNPSVVYKDPISPDTFIATEQSAYLAMLQEAHQLHYALAGDAAVSGESRKQSRDAFKNDLLLTAGQVEACLRWLLETSLAMASWLAGQPNRFAELRAYVRCRVDSGPVGPDDLRAASELADKGIWSLETAMAATGIEDTEAEKRRIEKERSEQQQGDQASLALAQQALDRMRQTNQPGQTNGQNGNLPVSQNGTAPQVAA